MRALRWRQSYDVITTDVIWRHQGTTSLDTNQDMAVAFSSKEQRMCIKFESYRKKYVREIHVALMEVYGNSALLSYFTSLPGGLTNLTAVRRV